MCFRAEFNDPVKRKLSSGRPVFLLIITGMRVEMFRHRSRSRDVSVEENVDNPVKTPMALHSTGQKTSLIKLIRDKLLGGEWYNFFAQVCRVGIQTLFRNRQILVFTLINFFSKLYQILCYIVKSSYGPK